MGDKDFRMPAGELRMMKTSAVVERKWAGGGDAFHFSCDQKYIFPGHFICHITRSIWPYEIMADFSKCSGGF